MMDAKKREEKSDARKCWRGQKPSFQMLKCCGVCGKKRNYFTTVTLSITSRCSPGGGSSSNSI